MINNNNNNNTSAENRRLLLIDKYLVAGRLYETRSTMALKQRTIPDNSDPGHDLPSFVYKHSATFLTGTILMYLGSHQFLAPDGRIRSRILNDWADVNFYFGQGPG